MTAYNTGALLQGLNDGAVNMWKFGLQQRRLDRQEERQAEADRRSAEAHETSQRANQIRLAEVEREIRERDGARQAATPEVARDGVAVGQPGSRAFYTDPAAAQQQAEMDAFISGSDAPEAPKPATGVTGGGAPRIAGFGTKANNSREATAKRVADYWRNLGETDKADEIERRAQETSAQMYEAGRQALWRNALSASVNGPQAFVDALYKGYNDGFDARVVQLPGGGGRVERVDQNGNVVGSIDFRDMRDLTNRAYAMVFPDKVRQAEAEAASKTHEVAPGGTIVRGDGSVLYRNTTEHPTVAAARIRAGASGASGSSGSGSGSGSGSRSGGNNDPLSAASDAWEFVSTKGEIKLAPQQLAQGRRMTMDIARGGIDSALAAEVALDVVMDPAKATIQLDRSTGRVDLIYQNPRVNQGQPIVISPSAGTLDEFAKTESGKAELTNVAQQTANAMLSRVAPENRQQEMQRLRAIASDPAQRREYLEAAAAAGKDVETINRQLDIIRGYLPPDRPQRQQDGGDRQTREEPQQNRPVPRPTDPNSPAGQFQARQALAKQEEQQRQRRETERARLASEQFNRDKLSMDPVEFVRKYDSMRSQLSREDLIELRRIENEALRTR